MSSNLRNISFDDDNAQEEENEDFPNQFNVEPPSYVFCVDGRKKMMEIGDGLEQPPLLLSFRCIKNIVRNYITSSAKCSCAIILAGCDKTENSTKVKNMNILKSMSLLSADTMKIINEACADIENGNYEKKYGFGALSLADCFWQAATMLSKKSKLKRKIILFTNEDDPCANDSQGRTQAITKVNDFELSDIELQVLGIGESFDYSKFYKELLKCSGDTEPIEYPSTTLEQLISLCSQVKLRHVALTSIPFRFSNDLTINVSVHTLVRKAKLPAKIKLCSTSNQIVKSKFRTYDEETGEKVEPENLVKFKTVAGKNIYHDSADLKKINEIGERGLQLLGFKPKSQVLFELHVKPGAFLYPSGAAKGESLLFQGLLDRCSKKGVVAICTYCPRPTSSVRFVALVPQLESTDKFGTQTSPPGFQLVYLPFGDEVRDWNTDCTGKARATPEQVQLMQNVVKKLRINFRPESFPNPQLAKHWAGIEALALDLREEPTRDETLPDYERIGSQLQDLPEQIQQEIYPDGYSVEMSSSKKKSDFSDLPINITAIEEVARNKELNKLKVDHLKNYLKHVGLGYGLSKMKKDDCISKINQHLKLPS